MRALPVEMLNWEGEIRLLRCQGEPGREAFFTGLRPTDFDCCRPDREEAVISFRPGEPNPVPRYCRMQPEM